VLEEKYRAMMAYFARHPAIKRLVCGANRILPYLVAVLFLFGGGFLAYSGLWKECALYLGICAGKFLLATLIRRLINAPRPYDRFQFEPLVVVEHGKGKSFPSRHTASGFIIARALFALSPWLGVWPGIVALIFAALIGVCRVLTGCHFPKDVLIAAVFFL
jgi:membrane-associated phospholipid phosphatase